MSKVTEIFDYFISVAGTHFSTYERLPNPYIIEENNKLALEEGYAVSYGPGFNEDISISKEEDSVTRDFIVTQVIEISASRNNVELIEEVEKKIMDERQAFKDAIDDDPSLGCIANRTQFVSDDGLEFLSGEETDAKYYRLTSTFEVNYFDV